MHALTDRELYQAIEYAKSIDQNTGRTILEKFQTEQPALAHTLFTLFPSMIAAKNQDMAHLFMDLCFDVICIYQHAFGEIPAQNTQWLQKQTSLSDTELQSLISGNKADPKVIKKLQQNSKAPLENEINQTGLISFMNQSIQQYAEQISTNKDTIKTTEKMISTVIRLFNSVYSQATIH